MSESQNERHVIKGRVEISISFAVIFDWRASLLSQTLHSKFVVISHSIEWRIVEMRGSLSQAHHSSGSLNQGRYSFIIIRGAKMTK